MRAPTSLEKVQAKVRHYAAKVAHLEENPPHPGDSLGVAILTAAKQDWHRWRIFLEKISTSRRRHQPQPT